MLPGHETIHLDDGANVMLIVTKNLLKAAHAQSWASHAAIASVAKGAKLNLEGEATLMMYPLCAGGAHELLQLHGHKASGARRNIVRLRSRAGRDQRHLLAAREREGVDDEATSRRVDALLRVALDVRGLALGHMPPAMPIVLDGVGVDVGQRLHGLHAFDGLLDHLEAVPVFGLNTM